jgi:cob(I)alamin adenosyltransferase
MLYTRKGDKGDTGLFGCNQRISKSSSIAEALGSLDEINSFLGICKVLSSSKDYKLSTINFSDLVHSVQQNLFIIQAELAGSDMTVSAEKIKEIEGWIGEIENILPPIKSFFISGGTELGATFDVARTIARRAERRVVAVVEEGKTILISKPNSTANRPLAMSLIWLF